MSSKTSLVIYCIQHRPFISILIKERLDREQRKQCTEEHIKLVAIWENRSTEFLLNYEFSKALSKLRIHLSSILIIEQFAV